VDNYECFVGFHCEFYVARQSEGLNSKILDLLSIFSIFQPGQSPGSVVK